MPIYQLDPDAAKRQQYNMVMQMLVNAAMQRTQLEARKKEAEVQRTWEEAREKRAQDFQEKILGTQLHGEGKATPLPTTKGGIEGDVTLAGRDYKINPRTTGILGTFGNYLLQADSSGKITASKIGESGSLEKNYEYAKTQGFKGSIEDFIKSQRQTIMQEKPASAGERTNIAEARAAISSLNNLNELFKGAYVGPIVGRVGKAKDIFGANPQTQSEFYAASYAFRNAIIKQITGAQMSEPEAKRIREQIPEPTDPPKVWKAKWRQSLRNVQELEKKQLEILKQSGLKTPSDSPAANPNDPLGLFK